MFKTKKKQNGTYPSSSSWFSRNKRALKLAVLPSAILILAVSVAGWLFNRDQTKDKLLEIPEAVASDLPGWWYDDYFGASVCDSERCKPNADPDEDKLTNAQEFYYHTNPLNVDTNANGLTDGEDVAAGYDPSKPGKMTFEEAASDDQVVLESLVFDSDVKKLLNEEVSPDKAWFPTINEQELNVTQDNSLEALKKFEQDSSDAVNRYFPKDRQTFIADAIQSQSRARLDDLKLRAAKTLIDLKKVAVPSDALQLHKYGLMIFMLLPSVIDPPAENIFNDEYNAASNLWYDQARAFMFLPQKIDVETEKLNAKLR